MDGPLVDDARYGYRWNKREESQQPHMVRSGKPSAEHHYPQVEWGLVGEGHAVVGEGEEGTVAQCLVGDTQIAKLVRGGEIAQQQHWDECCAKSQVKQVSFSTLSHILLFQVLNSCFLQQCLYLLAEVLDLRGVFHDVVARSIMK